MLNTVHEIKMFTEFPQITDIDIKMSLKKHHILSTVCYIEQFLRQTEIPMKRKWDSQNIH